MKLTCHMGTHSVNCHPAEVTFLAIKAGNQLGDPGWMLG